MPTFPLTYSALLDPLAAPIKETQTSYCLLTEKHLHVLWLEQRFFMNLQTSTNERIEVLSPGIWNQAAGPDFLRAHLKIGGIEQQGDIELHLIDDSWVHHHHHEDPRYDQVILHLSFWLPTKAKPLYTSQKRVLPRAYLEPSLTQPLTKILAAIDLDLYPYRKFFGSGRCAHTLFCTLPSEEATALFRKAAWWRLQHKWVYLQAHATIAELIFPLGFAQALGYKNNATSFVQLFISLYQHLNSLKEHLFSLCLGLCGYFAEPYASRWHSSTAYQQWKDQWHSLTKKPALQLSLCHHQVRPFNHPIRRLAFLVHLIADPQLLGYADRLLAQWNRSWQGLINKKEALRLWRQLQQLLPSYRDRYWNAHFLFEKEPKEYEIPLFGDELQTRVLINAFFPILAEEIRRRNNPREQQAFFFFYSCLPAEKSGKTAYLSHRFFGESTKSQLFHRADLEQGAYQLHRDFCIHYEASCEGCPFVERYTSFSQQLHGIDESKSLYPIDTSTTTTAAPV